MKRHAAWRLAGWVYLAHFILGLFLWHSDLFSSRFLFAFVLAALNAFWVTLLVMLGVWMYKLDRRRNPLTPINTTKSIE